MMPRSLTADEQADFFADSTTCWCGHPRSSHSATEPTGGCYGCPDSGPRWCDRFEAEQARDEHMEDR